MSDGETPFINDYKRKFVQKRLLENLLGGVLLNIESDDDIPCFIYFLQILLFVMPFAFGTIPIILIDVARTDTLYTSIIGASIFLLYVFILRAVALIFNFRAYLKDRKIQPVSPSDLSLSHLNNSTRKINNSDTTNYEFEGFFSMSTLNFILPLSTEISRKRNIFYSILRILCDASIAGVVMFFSIYLLNFNYTQPTLTTGGAVCLFTLNWLTIIVALNALVIREPPEPAMFQPYGSILQHFTRSFYVLTFLIIEFSYNYQSKNLTSIVVLKVLTALLPIAWIFGTLPPLDALILFLLEQCHVFAFGGSPVSSTIRLVIQIIGAALLSLVFFIPNNLAIILLLANFGYIFASLDGRFLLKKCLRVLKQKHANSTCHVAIESQYNWKDWTFHFVMIILVNLITVLTCLLLKSSSINQAALFTLETSLLYAGLGIFGAIKLLGDVQRVYVIFGLIRNPFYPKHSLSDSCSSSTMKSVNEKRVAFTIVKYIRLVLLRIVAPCLLCAFIATDCVLYELNFNTFDYLQIICILRAFRWIWQSTFLCLFEMCFMSNVLLYSVIYPSSSSSAVTQLQLTKYFLLSCLAASFVRDRLEQLIGKTFTFFMITITAWSVKKQRRTAALVLLVLNFLLFLPIGLVYIGVVSLLSAPLLALFTFPIYLIGFPRYKRFWPEKKQQISPEASVVPYSNVDGIFYHQLMPTLLESFKEHIRSASIGEGIKPDTFYLSRFQDRIIWIQILESSNTGCVMSIKGLELQETSCHTREAQHIDDIFDLAFENPDGSSGNSDRKKLISLNPSVFACMQPLDVLVFQGYSDAKNSLVGILDNPETIQSIYEFFPKILHYFLVHKLIELTKSVDTVAANEITGIDNMGNSLEDDELDVNGNYGKSKTPSANSTKSKSLEDEYKFDILNKSIQSEDSFVQVAKEIREDSASNWSDSSSDNDSEKAIKKPKAKLSTLSSKVAPKLKTDSALKRTSDHYDFNELLGAINMDNETVEKSVTQTKLSRDISIDIIRLKKTHEKEKKSFKQQQQQKTEVELGPIKHKKASVITPVTKSKRPMSSQRGIEQATFSLPRDWVEGVKDSGMSNQRLQADNEAVKMTLMSKEWISQLFKNLDRPDLEQEYETALNSGVCVFILKCCNLLGINKSSVNFNPASICTFYAGKLPWSPLNERITNEHPDLFALLVRAFRYTVKMVIDNVTICPIGDDADFYETLNEYKSDWFIGVEKDPEFSENLLQNKNYLFSLYKDDTNREICSRTLSLQQIRSPIAKLNNEVIKSIWSSTNLELLFMTNDDDERYSIQANKYTLRNITIQSSEPPLGYSVYNSDEIHVSLANPFF